MQCSKLRSTVTFARFRSQYMLLFVVQLTHTFTPTTLCCPFTLYLASFFLSPLSAVSYSHVIPLFSSTHTTSHPLIFPVSLILFPVYALPWLIVLMVSFSRSTCRPSNVSPSVCYPPLSSRVTLVTVPAPDTFRFHTYAPFYAINYCSALLVLFTFTPVMAHGHCFVRRRRCHYRTLHDCITQKISRQPPCWALCLAG